jgi:acetolactate synthase-1/2/3 large subunit
MLMVTGQKPIKTSKQGRFQVLDVVDMMQPLTKYTTQVVSGDRVPAVVREAFRLAHEERPGAAHIELPEDIAAEDTDAGLIAPSAVRRPIAEYKAVDRAVAMIEAARSPVLLIGAAANRKLTAKMLREFVAKTDIPFITTQMGKGVLDEHGPRFLGNTALSDHDFVHRVVQAADLIINVGHDVVEKPPFFMRPTDQRQVMHVNFDSAMVDPVYFPQLEVVGDIANSIWQIKERIAPQPHWNFELFRRAHEAYLAHREESEADERFPLRPEYLVRAVRRVMPAEGIVTLDNGIYKIWFARNYPAAHPNTLLLDNALATMGAGLPSAMTAKLVYPQRPVLAVCGDGGFMMNSQEMETAVRLGLHLVVLVLRDDAYGMIKWKQADMQLPDFGLDYGNPDFVRYAEAYGARGWRVGATAELEPLLARCLDEPAVHIIDVPVDYSMNTETLFTTIPRLSASL